MSSVAFFKYSDDDKKEILSQYDRTLDNIQQDVESIKSWLSKQPHIPEIPADHRIEHFLYMGKFSFERVKQIIDWSYTIRGMLPIFFKDPENPTMQIILNQFYFFPLPQLTPLRHRVVIHKLRKPKLDQDFDAKAYVAYSVNIGDVLINEDCPTIKVLVFDLSDIKLDFSSKFTPTLLKQGIAIFEKAFSNSLQQIHILNMPLFVEATYNLFKSFLKPKIAQRIHIHKDMDSLFEFIPKSLLPKDCGGDELSYEELHNLWKQKLIDMTPWFKKRNSLLTNEGLRIDKPLDCESLGFHGNFRKLTLD